jgi:uncharacterized delta-60 repeat protein
MLFDLEEYRVMGITGKDHVHVHQIRWDDAWIAQRATLDAYYNTIREYGETAVAMAPASEVSTILEKSFIALEKLSSFRKISKEFWNAMCSIAIVGSFNEGDKFDYTTVNMDDVVDGVMAVDYQDLTWIDSIRIMNPYKFVAFRNENGDFEYRSMTQALYNSYYTALTDAQSAVKTLMLTGEGVSTIAEFVPPLVPAWNESAELSGYVRDSRSLPISGVTVRLVDADGVNHDLVTNDLGYYHFTKEYIYNNISLGTASSMEFDMFILEETLSGTVLYNSTNILQNSFFGAINDRDLVWPVLVKSGKQNRRNFKIEFIPDYSTYPSLSGHVYDQDGNPAANALVQLKYKFNGYANYDNEGLEWVNIGDTYNSITQKWSKNTKFKLFGEDKSILTDENGFYEYPSQMIGEWFNNHYKVAFIQTNGTNADDEFFSKALVYNPYTPVVGFKVDDTFNDIGNASTSLPQAFRYISGNSWDIPWQAWFEQEYNSNGVQSDGKIIIGGDIWAYNGQDIPQNRYAYGNEGGVSWQGGAPNSIIRLNVDGSLDETFNPDIYSVRYSSGEIQVNPYINNVQVLSDDKILVAGNFNGVAGATAHGLVLLNSDGSLNTVYDFVSDSFGQVTTDAKMLPNGKVLALNSWWSASTLVVFNADGTVDGFLGADNNNPDRYNLEKSWIGGGTIYGSVYSGSFLKANIYNNHFFQTSSNFTYINVMNDGSFFLSGSFIIEALDSNGQPTGFTAENFVKFNVDGTVDETFKCILIESHNEHQTESGVFASYYSLYSDTNFNLHSGVSTVIKEESGSYLIGGKFYTYLTIDADGNYVATPVRHLVRLSATGSLISIMEGAVDPTFDGVGSYWNYSSGSLVPVSYGTAYSVMEMELVETPAGKKLFVMDSSGQMFIIDYSTGLYHPQRLALDNNIYSMIKTGNDMIILGRFTGYREYGKNSDGTNSGDLLSNKYYGSAKLGGLLKLTYGSYEHIQIYYGLNPVIQQLRNPNNPSDVYSHSFTVNDVKVVLNPWVQDPITGTIYDLHDKDWAQKPQPSKIYDYQNWFNSRFGYSFNEREEEYSFELHGGLGKDKVLDIQELLTDQESGAEIVQLGKRIGSGIDVLIKTTTGFATLRNPVTGEYHTYGSGDSDGGFRVNNYSDYFTLPEMGTMSGTIYYDIEETLHLFSSEGEHGAAEGKIKYLSLNGYNFNWNTNYNYTRVLNGSLRNLTQLETLFSWGGINKDIDVTGVSSLKELYVDGQWSHEVQITGIETLNNLQELQLSGDAYSYKTVKPNEFIYVPDSTRQRESGVSDGPQWWFEGIQGSSITKLPNGKYVVSGMRPSEKVPKSNVQYGGNDTIQSYGLLMLDENFEPILDSPINKPTDWNLRMFQNHYEVNAVAAQSTGKMLVGGIFSTFKGVSLDSPGIIRINEQGELDTTFVFSGASIDNSNYGNGVYKIHVMSDDSFYLCGNVVDTNGTCYGAAKFSANGQFITGYSANYNFGYFIESMLVQSDGKVIIPESSTKLTRFNVDGTIDSGYDGALDSYIGGSCKPLSIDSLNRVYVITTQDNLYNMPNNSGYRLRRLTANGQLDQDWMDSFVDFLTNHTSSVYGNQWSSADYYSVKVLSDDSIILNTQAFNGGPRFFRNNRNEINSSTSVILDSNANLTNTDLLTNFGYIDSIVEDGDSLLLIGDQLDGYNDGAVEWQLAGFGVLKKVNKHRRYLKLPYNNNVLQQWNSNFGINAPQLFEGTDIDYSGVKGSELIKIFNMGGQYNISGLTNMHTFNILTLYPSMTTVNLVTNDTIYTGLTKIETNATCLDSFTLNAPNVNEIILNGPYSPVDSGLSGYPNVEMGSVSSYTNLENLVLQGFYDSTSLPDLSSNALVKNIVWYGSNPNNAVDMDLTLSQLVQNEQTDGHIYIYTKGISISEQGIADKETLVNRGWSFNF